MNLAAIKEADNKQGDCGYPADSKPSWLNLEKFQHGREFFLKHAAMIILSWHFSLTVGLAVSNLLEALVFTNQSNTPEKAKKRYLETAHYLVTWFVEDIWDAPHGKGYKNVQKVRKMHNIVAANMNKHKQNQSRTSLSQYDMTVVLSGFMGAVVMYPEKFGIHSTPDELDDYVYVWRCIGYLLGIDNQYNICSNGYMDAYIICKEIENAVVIPGLREPPEHFELMVNAYIDGQNSLFPFPPNSVNSILACCIYFNEWELKIPPLTLVDYFRIFYLKLLTLLVWYFPRFEAFLNRRALKVVNILHAKNC